MGDRKKKEGVGGGVQREGGMEVQRRGEREVGEGGGDDQS